MANLTLEVANVSILCESPGNPYNTGRVADYNYSLQPAPEVAVFSQSKLGTRLILIEQSTCGFGLSPDVYF